MKKLLPCLLLVMAIIPSSSYAVKHDYICKIAGYYDAMNEHFLHAMASRVIEKNNMLDDISCQTDIKFGNNVAHKVSRLGKVESDDEMEVQMHAKHFSDLVYDAILSKIKLNW